VKKRNSQDFPAAGLRWMVKLGQHPIAAISVSGPAFRITPEKVPVVAQSMIGIANALSKELGMRNPPVSLVERGNRESQVQEVGA
jgi:hypothetical protein